MHLGLGGLGRNAHGQDYNEECIHFKKLVNSQQAGWIHHLKS